MLERLAQSIIDRLDDMDSDADVEPNGDEEDGNSAEDDFSIPCGTDWNAGCSLSDPAEDDSRRLLPACYDGEDQGIIILLAPKGRQPTRYRVS